MRLRAFEENTNEIWQKIFAINFYSAVYGIRAVIPIMKAQGGGHIIDVISGIAFVPMAFQTMYSATKAALNGLTLALRYEYWDENICFTSATPGTTITAIWGDNRATERSSDSCAVSEQNIRGSSKERAPCARR